MAIRQTRRHFGMGALLTLGTLGLMFIGQNLALAAPAAPYPERPVTLIVPFPAGGPTDLVARVLAKQLTEQMGQPFIVENKGGANGNIGMQAAATAGNDGYTLLYNTSSIALSPNLYRSLSFDPAKDFVGISTTATIPLVLLTHPSLPTATVQEFIDYAKQRPGKLSYASSSIGNVTHLTNVMFLQAVDVQAMHVPYRGSAPALTDLVGGQVMFMTNTLNDSLPFIRDGRVRALAISSAKRSDRLPEIPTLAQSGLPEFDVGAWQGVVAPRGTPVQIIERLNAEIRKALASEVMQAQLALQGAYSLGSTPQEYDAFIRSETQRWGQVIKAAQVTLE